jgi:hypothetical protein
VLPQSDSCEVRSVQTKSAKLILLFVVTTLSPLLIRAQAEKVALARHGDSIEVAIGGKPFTTYHFDTRTAKAYLQPLRTSQGVIVTRGFPVGDTIPAGQEHDPSLEPHQRPLATGTLGVMISGVRKYSGSITGP